MISTWGAVTTSTATSPTRWSAQTSVTIRNNYNVAVSGATVVIKVQYRKSSGSWSTAPNLTGTTNATGTLLLDSGLYNSTGSSRADEIRFQVTSVTKSGLTWTSNTSTVGATKPN